MEEGVFATRRKSGGKQLRARERKRERMVKDHCSSHFLCVYFGTRATTERERGGGTKKKERSKPLSTNIQE
jgi:hypothetical protein